MENAKPVLGFLAGVVVASVFFLVGLDHQFGRFFRFSRNDGIALAIVPSGVPAHCPPSYAVDNRTDRPVFFTFAGVPPDFGGPPHDDDRSGDPSYDNGASRDYLPAASYDASDITGSGGDTTPDSAEPGIRATDETYSADSNYGGSLAGYGADGPNHFGDDAGDARMDEDVHDDGSEAGAYDRAGGEHPRGGYFGGVSDIPPPPPGQPIPLTPPENSSPYGVPHPAPYDGPGDAGYGPPANRVRPGEIFFASANGSEGTDGPRPGCHGRDNTVTVQLSN